MKITNMNLKTRSDNSSITVEFDYNEIRDIANGLYYTSNNDKRYEEIYVKSNVLFNMIKYGFIRPETVAEYNKLIENNKGDKEKW